MVPPYASMELKLPVFPFANDLVTIIGTLRSKEEEKWRNTDIEDPDPQICELLLCACSRGNLVDFRRLLQDDSTLLSRRDKNNYSPMSVFAFKNFGKFVSTVLDVFGPCILDRELFVGPLFVAIAMGHNTIVESLVQAGVSPNKFFPSFATTAFRCAAQYGNLHCVKMFAPAVEQLPDRLVELIGALEEAFFYDRKSIAAWALPMYRSILASHTCIVDKLIHAIVRGGAVEIATWLVQDTSVLWFCLRSRLLRLYPGNSAILECCSRGNASFLAWILQTFRREAIEKCGEFDTSLLWLCLELNKMECLQAIVDNVREVRIAEVYRVRSGKKESLLSWACVKGDAPRARALIRMGCDPDELMEDGCDMYSGTPLCVKVVQIGSIELLCVLVTDGHCNLMRYTQKMKGACPERALKTGNGTPEPRTFMRLCGPVKGSALYSAILFRHTAMARWIYSTLNAAERLRLASPEMVFLCYMRGSDLFKPLYDLLKEATRDAPTCTILDVALKNGELSAASQLLEMEPDLPFSDAAILKVVEDDCDCIPVLDWCSQNGKPIFNICRSLVHDTCTSSSINLFGTACLHGRLQVVQYLIDLWDGPKAKLVDSKFFGIAPVSWACLGGHLEVVLLLTKYGASLNTIDTYENTLLHLAAARGKSVELLEFLLRSECRTLLEHINYLGRTVLLECVARSSCDSVELHKCERSNEGRNPACDRILREEHICKKSWSCIQLVEKLVGAGSSIHATDKGGNTLVDLASLSGDVPVLKYCLDNGLSFAYKSPTKIGPPEGPVWIAAMYARCAALEFIVDVAMPLSLGVSPREFESSSASLVTLLRMGMHCPDPMRRIEYLKHMLFKRRYIELKQLGPLLLLECATTPERNLVLELFLLETTAKLDWSNPMVLEKSLGGACEIGDLLMVKTLVKLGCPLNNRFGEKSLNCLMCAVMSGSKPLVRWLISRGCNPFETDSEGCNAFDYATEAGDQLAEWISLEN